MLMTQESSDPDLNLQLLNDHGIYTIEEINELSRTVKPQYSALHLNSRRLKQHFDEMCYLLDSISCKFDLIACSETWFTSETDNTCFQIPGYTLVSDNRTFLTGCGVALNVSYYFAIRNNLKIDSIENLWIETTDMIVGVIYKPPNFSNPEFLDKFETIVHNVFLSKKRRILMGDINIIINILKKTSVSREYLNLLQSEGFSQLIFEATRITENSQSCIDHILFKWQPCS